jgi:hypothetical protein
MKPVCIREVARQMYPDFKVPGKIVSFIAFVQEKEIEFVLKTALTDLSPGVIQGVLCGQDLGEMTKHAVSEGTKAICKFRGFEGERSGKGWRSRAARLTVPTILIGRMTKNDLSDEALVYFTGVIEYFTAEILETYIREHRSCTVGRSDVIGIMAKVIGKDRELQKLLLQITDLSLQEIFNQFE